MTVLLLAALLAAGLAGCASSLKPGIYMGILRAADTPGREVTLFLLSNGSFVEKTQFLDSSTPAAYGYGTYRVEGQDLVMTYVNGTVYTYRLIRGALMDKAGPVQDDLRRGFGLFRISD